jgi:ABC-type uncharacterized transport system permease subunit
MKKIYGAVVASLIAGGAVTLLLEHCAFEALIALGIVMVVLLFSVSIAVMVEGKE